VVESGSCPGIDGSLFKGFVVFVSPIAPEVALEIVPEVFDGVKFWALGREFDEGHVLWNVELLTGVEGGPIPEHDGLHVVRNGFG
jgi:hypothetical protein